MATKDDILAALRRDALTVAQLCQHLGVTRNAVQVQLRQLKAEGLVQTSSGRQNGRVGKPATVYEAAAGSEDADSLAYLPFVASLLAVLGQRLDQTQLRELLEETGRRMARDAGLADPADAESGLATAMAVANSLGAMAEAEVQDSGVVVRNYSCPLASAIRVENCVCGALAAFFSEATGRNVEERCLRNGHMQCQYMIDGKAAAPGPASPAARSESLDQQS